MNTGDFMAEALKSMQTPDESSLSNEQQPQEQTPVEGQQTQPAVEEPAPTPAGEQTATQEPVPPAATEPVQPTEPVTVDREQIFKELLHEKSGGKFEDWDAVLNQETPTPSELDEKLQKIQEYMQNGGSFENFIISQSTDYDTLSDLELVKEKMFRDNPTMDVDDIEFLIARKYKLDEEQFEEDDVRMSKIELKGDASKAREALKKIQDDLRLPEGNKRNVQEDLAKKQAEQNAKLEAQRKQWLSDVDATVKDFKEVTFKVGEQEYKHVVTDEQRANVQNLNNDLSTFFGKYQNQDGTVDHASLHRDRYILEYFPQIMRTAISQAKATGTQEIVDQIKNPSVTAQTQTPDNKPKTIENQVNDILYRNIL